MKKILILIAFVLLISCGGNDTGITPSNFTQKTPDGATVKTATPASLTTLNTVDQSLTKLFSDARFRGYTQKLNYSDYSIIIRNDCVNRNGVMSWLERNDDYNNTQFDQNPDPNIGEIYQAEQARPPSTEYTICQDTDETMLNTVRYGAEHLILYFNDPQEFERTKIHTDASNSHPIIPIR